MATGTSKVLPSELLTLKDRLSRLTFIEACKLLGADGRGQIQRNANKWDISINDDVHISADLLRVRFPVISGEKPIAFANHFVCRNLRFTSITARK